jgi:hypothetical protein
MTNETKNEVKEWLKIPGLETYEISSCGKLRNKYMRVLNGSLKKDHGKVTKTRVIYSMTHRGKKYRIYASRLVAAAFLDFDLLDKNLVVDHIDNDSMNDNVENLQIITHRKNNTKDAKNKCGYTGVSKNGNGYTSYITINRRQTYLGYFTSPLLASQAYLNALKEI